ncbi:MAG: 2-hydroxyacid dehydrogenase [Micrococcales bacterium]|nr:2-hydroxyacid dehydrogenase [Micrococcales bacterium]
MWICLPNEEIARSLGPIEDVDVVVWDLDGEPPAGVAQAEFLVGPQFFRGGQLQTLRTLGQLRHVQLVSAGFEHALPFVPPGATLSNAPGVHDAATAEMALTLILAAQRNIPDYVDAQRRGRWESSLSPGLADRRVLVVGYGHIGRAIVRRLQPFEVDVSVVASRARGGDGLIDRVHGIEELPDLLFGADIVILIVPLTPATEHLIDSDALARMRPGALLVNVARGKVVDTDALIEACGSHRVRAALDVTEPEPLPQDHPLFATPGVFIAPHAGGNTDAFLPRIGRFLRQQVDAYRAGSPISVQNG